MIMILIIISEVRDWLEDIPTHPASGINIVYTQQSCFCDKLLQ